MIVFGMRAILMRCYDFGAHVRRVVWIQLPNVVQLGSFESMLPRSLSRALRDPRRPRSVAWIVTLVYLAMGALWMVTDVLLEPSADGSQLAARIDTTKDWLFITVTAFLIFMVTNRAMKRFVRAESVIHAVFDSIEDGVLIVNDNRTIVSANPAAVRMLGAINANELVGVGPDEFVERFHLSHLDGRLIAAGPLRQEPAPTRPVKVRLHPPERPELVALFRTSPIRIHMGAAHSVSVIHDVTESESLEQSREKFFSAAAHAFQTPVSVIKAEAHLLRLGGPRAKGADRVIERQCGRLGRLVDNVLALVRIRTGTLELQPENVECAEVVDAVAREMANAHSQHDLVSKIESDPVVFADRTTLELILRDVIEVAYRCAVAHTDIRVVLDAPDSVARIRVMYEPLETRYGLVTEAAGYDGLGVERHVVESLVEASGGQFHSSHESQIWTDWIEIPKVSADDSVST